MNLQDISPLEWWANGTTALSVFLAATGHILTWPIGIVGCVLFGWLFYEARLYADLTLQLFFIGTSALGWLQWQRAGGPGPCGQAHALNRSTLAAMVLTAMVVALLYGLLLQHWTQAFAPFWDSAVLTASVVAQILLMRGHPQTWPAWLLVNTLSVPLYLQRGLHVTAALYAAFWLNAWWGWWRWRQLAQQATAASGMDETPASNPPTP
jgi:nicotinamide mononucleotide transporter